MIQINEYDLRKIIKKILLENIQTSEDIILNFISKILNKNHLQISIIQPGDTEYEKISGKFRKLSCSEYFEFPGSELDRIGKYCIGVVDGQNAVMTNIMGYQVFYT